MQSLLAASVRIHTQQQTGDDTVVSGAALAGGSRGPDPPPATARTTCEIRLNPRTFFRGEGVWGGGSAITLFKTYIGLLQSAGRF